MSIECYRDECEFHGINNGVEGPFCDEPECIMQGHKVNVDDYSTLATVTEAPVTMDMKSRMVTAAPYIKKIFEEQIMLSNRLDLLKKYIFYGKPWHLENGSILDIDSINRILEVDTIRLIHSAVGLATETGEIMEALQLHIFGGVPLDKTNIKEEYGDAAWYIGIGCDTIGCTLTDCLTTNIEKLEFRYPEKFTEYHAEHRDLTGERLILEQDDNPEAREN